MLLPMRTQRRSVFRRTPHDYAVGEFDSPLAASRIAAVISFDECL